MTTNVITDSGAFAWPYTNREISEAINALPSLWGAMIKSGMFKPEGQATQFVQIFYESAEIYALPVGKSHARNGTGGNIIIEVPKVEHYDFITPADIKGWLSIMERSGGSPETFAAKLNEKLELFKKKFDLTREIMMTGAVKGVVIDGANSEIYNLFTMFGVSPVEIFFDLDNSGADIAGVCDLIYDLIGYNLSDETMTRVEAMVSPTFFRKLVRHAQCAKYYENTQAYASFANLNQQREGNFVYREYQHGNVLFRENPAVVPFKGGPAPLVEAGYGHAYPAGTMNSHKGFVAPPDDLAALNGEAASVDQLIHITQDMKPHNEGVELKGAMSYLPIWKRPKLLLKLNAAAGSNPSSPA